jgi:hypothetical protein
MNMIEIEDEIEQEDVPINSSLKNSKHTWIKEMNEI